MNPWPIVLADLRALRWVAWVTPLLIAVAVAVGVGISAQEAALRQSTARAADEWDSGGHGARPHQHRLLPAP